LNATRFLPGLLAGMTQVVLLGNALPAAQQKHRLQRAERRLLRDRTDEALRRHRLLSERSAIRGDAFYLERLYIRTWAKLPEGAIRYEEAVRPAPEFEE